MPRGNAGAPFNVILQDDDQHRLKTLAQKARNSQGYILRQAITWLYQMIVSDVPTCANGQTCLCPHLHPRKAQPQVTEPIPPQPPAA